MEFFNKPLVDQFKSETTLSDKFFYNLSDLFAIFSRTSIPTKKRLIQQIIGSVCKSSIGPDYSKVLSNNVVNNPDNYDFIAISSIEITNNLTDISGFMIVEKGECGKYPENYCVNLICGTGTGGVLLALYVYIIIQTDAITQKIGLLELANAYYNVGGLCLYQKYGFKFDKDLSSEDCFQYFPPNLPMLVNIDDYGSTKEAQTARLIAILQGVPNSSFIKDSICSLRGYKQTLVSLVLNLELSTDITRSIKMDGGQEDLSEYIYGKYDSPFETADGTMVDYKKLLTYIQSEYEGNTSAFKEAVIAMDDEEAHELLNRFLTPPPLPLPPSQSAPRVTRSSVKAPTTSHVPEEIPPTKSKTKKSGRKTPIFGGRKTTRKMKKTKRKKLTQKRKNIHKSK